MPRQTVPSRPPLWQILLAFSAIYFIWGSTFLAIRIGVSEVPPFLYAAFRFLAAGALLFAFSRWRGVPMPGLREWGSALLLGCLVFVLDYGSVFWAEQCVPSGIAAVILATIPVFMTISDLVLLRARNLSLRSGIALLVGFLGVAVLLTDAPSLHDTPIDRRGIIALLVGALSWSIASALTRRLPLPASKQMSAAAQMSVGGLLLLLLAIATGEPANFHPHTVSLKVWLALAYLIVPGSIVAFTAYLWLLHHESPTKVGTYAYVNPVVAVILGYLFGGETLGVRTVAATVLILLSVLTIATLPKKV